MKSRALLLVAASVLTAAASAAAGCGTEDDSQFPDGGADGTGNGTSNGSSGPGIGASGGNGTRDDGGRGDGGCGPNLTGVVRDFKAWKDGAGHPDFEHYMGGGQKKMVLPALGADFKPQYNPAPDPAGGDIVAPGASKYITSPESFAQWYVDVPGVNQQFQYPLVFVGTDAGTGVSTYANSAFFPIDGKGFGDEGLDDGKGHKHNYGFTFELHTEFTYNGGEVFGFTGDDDLWTYINGKLAIDLGGVHQAQSQSVSLDEIAADFGLVKGATYTLDVFNAERHTTESNFRIDTSIEFTNCGQIVH